MSFDMPDAPSTTPLPAPSPGDDEPLPSMKRGRVRPMHKDDIEDVGRLFFKVFRNGAGRPTPEFRAYFTHVFFTAPSYAPELGSVVHEDAEGRIGSALSIVPMRFAVRDRVIVARLACAFMEDPAFGQRGGAQIALTVRPRQQDMCFTDSAAPVSAEHTRVAGGQVLPVQSLEWRRMFRPFRSTATKLLQRLGTSPARLLSAAAGPFDLGLRRVMTSLPPAAPEGLVARPLGRQRFIEIAPGMVERFAVHPAWEPDELGWLLDTAAMKTSDGRLQIHGVETAAGQLRGCFLHYGRAGGMAQVLNVLSVPGGEQDTIAAMLHHLDRTGHTGAYGMAQPFLMNALLRQRKMVFRYRGYFAVSTRHADIRDAIERGDVYLGGLAGESWSRLLTDFH